MSNFKIDTYYTFFKSKGLVLFIFEENNIYEVIVEDSFGTEVYRTQGTVLKDILDNAVDNIKQN